MISLIDIYSNGIILRSEFDKFLTGMCLQNLDSMKELIENIEIAFEFNSYMKADDLLKRWLENKNIKGFITEILDSNKFIN